MFGFSFFEKEADGPSRFHVISLITFLLALNDRLIIVSMAGLTTTGGVSGIDNVSVLYPFAATDRLTVGAPTGAVIVNGTFVAPITLPPSETVAATGNVGDSASLAVILSEAA